MAVSTVVATTNTPADTERPMSKRQKIKALQASDLNRTQQQPRIKSAASRERGYLKESGLKSALRPEDVLDPSLDLDAPELKFGRALGSTDARTRHRAVNALRAYLKARCNMEQGDNPEAGMSQQDLMKLWKGLWYCLYMADKVQVQSELSKRISKLIWCVGGTAEEDEHAANLYLQMCDEEEDEEDVVEDEDGDTMQVVKNTLDAKEEEKDEEEKEKDEEGDDSEMEEGSEEEEEDSNLTKHCRGAHLASLFIRTFFTTVRREWGNMDKYRVDKFYVLIRQMVAEVYKYMATRQWNLGIIRLFNDALYDEILSQIPNGMRLHLIDLVVEELAKANKAHAVIPLTERTFLDVLEPFFAMCQTEKDAVVQKRIMGAVLEKFLYDYSVVGNKALEAMDNATMEEEDDKEDLTFSGVHVGSIAQFIFMIASNEETQDRYREGLYEMHKMYMRRIKKVGKDVDMQEGSDSEDEDEVPTIEEPSKKELETVAEKEPEDVSPSSSKKKRNKKRKVSLEKEQSIDNIATDKKETKENSVDSKEAKKSDDSTAVSPKKKRNKKKRKQETEQSNGDAAVEAEKVVTPVKSVEEDEKKELPAAKKGKQEKKKPIDVGEVSSKNDNKPASSKKNKNKKRKQQDDEEDVVVDVTAPSSTKSDANFEASEKKSKKKNKKKKKKSNDDVIVISTKAQQDALLASSTESVNCASPPAADVRSSKDSDDEVSCGGDKSRRVSFGRVNFSKSHKASMKALKTSVLEPTALRTPEKSILLKKVEGSSSKKKSNKSKANRRKSNNK